MTKFTWPDPPSPTAFPVARAGYPFIFCTAFATAVFALLGLTVLSLIGLVLALIAAYLASIGNVVGSRNARAGVPVTQANTYGMAYGGLLTLCIHFGFGGELIMDWSPGYLGPMLYLTIFGSILAFGCYMSLIGRIGADYAAYVMLLIPVLALFLSTIFEGYHWRINNVSGIILVLMGNLVILTKPRIILRLFRRLFPLTA